MRLRDRHTAFQEWLDDHEFYKIMFMLVCVVLPGLAMVESGILELVVAGATWMVAWVFLRWAYVEGHWR